MGMERDAIVQLLLHERVRLTASAAVIARDVHAADDIFQQVVLAALQTCAAAFKTSAEVYDYKGWRWSMGTSGFRCSTRSRPRTIRRT